MLQYVFLEIVFIEALFYDTLNCITDAFSNPCKDHAVWKRDLYKFMKLVFNLLLVLGKTRKNNK